MNKQEFILRLKSMLSDFPEKEIKERIDFYSEMIDDRIEDGQTEEEAIKDIGTVEEIAKQIIDEIPLFKIIKHKLKNKSKDKTKSTNPKKRSWWEITLIAVGSPIWLSLLISFFAIIFSLYVSIWAIIISLFAVDLSLLLSSLGIIIGVIYIFTESASIGLLIISCAILCVGLSILFFYICKYTAKLGIFITKKITRLIKSIFISKEQIQ